MIGGWPPRDLYGAGRIASAAAMLIVVSAAPPLAWADAVVNLCQSADEGGPGTNLQQALTAPLNPNNATNNITFQCGGSATITVDRPLEIFQATAIDGGSSITLSGTNQSFRSSMFVVGSSATFLFLRNMTLTHPNTQRQACATSTCIGTVVNAQGTTELDNVIIQNSDTPVSAISGALTVSQSRFTGNSGTLIAAGPGVTSTIANSVFQDNPGATSISANGTVNISGSQFVANNSPSFFPGLCQLSVDNTTFQNNTDAPLFINCASATISNSLFAGNSASGFGGAMRFAAGAQQVILRADRFLSNNTTFGGSALWFAAPETADISVSVSSSTFTGNQGADGGAIFISQPKNPSFKTIMKLQRVSFSRNVATGAGGAISALGAELLVARSVFADNRAGTSGGAVALSNTPQLHSIFANTLFIRNHAASGSAYAGNDADFINTTVDFERRIGNKECRGAAAPHSPGQYHSIE